MSPPRFDSEALSVLIHVQHLLGIGHLQRMSILAQALVAADMQVNVVSGGPAPDYKIEGVAFHQLPSLASADGGFLNLITESGQSPDQHWRNRRRDQLLVSFDQFNPDAIIIETFPFGRRMLRFELLPLLEHAVARKPRPLIVGSVRDILQVKPKAGRAEETRDTCLRYFDRVLVHGDPALATLNESYALADELGERIVYTGYVRQQSNAQAIGKDGKDEVIVSAGGGAVGMALLETALQARELSNLANVTWRILVGKRVPVEQLQVLRKQAPIGVIIEAARPDFSTLLSRASVSISQAGYNTVLDLVSARCRSVLVPFEGDGESEQRLRAQKLAGLALAQVVFEADLNPRILAAAVNKAYKMEIPDVNLNMNGAQTSAALIKQWLES